MAVLQHKQSQEILLLNASHSFGRLKNSVDTFIPDPYMSKVHTLIEWCGTHWNIKDISSNGTWLNGNKLLKAQATPLNINDEITFASKCTNGYTVINVNPPCDALIPIGHEAAAIELQHYHLIPAQGIPKIILSYNNDTKSWWQDTLNDDLNSACEHIELSDKTRLTIDGLTWQLQTNQTAENTRQLHPSVNSLDELHFLFQTTLDEEATQAFLQNEQIDIDLKIRSHHYLTLTLARYRAKDIETGIVQSEQGWIYADILADELGLDLSHLNIQIYRIRKQFIDALNNNCDTSNIIERKAGKVRFATGNFSIKKAENVEFDASNYLN